MEITSNTYLSLFPSDLATYGNDAKALLKELQSQNERMFLLTFLVMNTGKSEHELENNLFQASSIAQKHNCNLVRLDYQQEQGLMSSLPLAYNMVDIKRGMTTSSTAMMIISVICIQLLGDITRQAFARRRGSCRLCESGR